MPERPRITIYPHSTLQTDYHKLEKLSRKSPAALKAAQKLLMATEKLILRKGWFTSDRMRHNRMVTAYVDFIFTLTSESFFSEGISAHGLKHASILYLDEMSEIFPNWQEAYAYLDKFIWEQNYWGG